MNHSTKSSKINSILKNIFSNWLGLVINIIIAFFMAPFTIHKLGNAQYGLWVIAMQFTGYLGMLELGIRPSITKYVATYFGVGEYQKINKTISAGIFIYALMAIVCIIITSLLTVFIPNFFNNDTIDLQVIRFIIIITGINVAQAMIFTAFHGILFGIQRFDIYNAITISTTFLRVILIVYFLSNGYGVVALGIIQLCISVINNVIAAILCKRKIPQLKIKIKYICKAYIVKIFNYSFIAFVINLCRKVIYYTDSFVISYFLGASMVTYYSIPLTLIEYVRRLLLSMNEVFNPLTSEINSNNDIKTINKLLIVGTKYSFALALAPYIVILFMGKDFIRLWIGEEYAYNATHVLTILAITHCVSVLHLTSHEILYGIAKHKFAAYLYMAEAACNFFLSILLVKNYGIVGVAIGTALPHIVVTAFVYPIVMKKLIQSKLIDYYYTSVIKPLLGSIVFIIICYLISTHYKIENLFEFFVLVALIMPGYFLPVWFIVIENEERAFIKGIFEKMILKLKFR